MFLENLQTDRSAASNALHCRRSLSGDFVFLSQNDSVAFAAEACIDVLRSANLLIGQTSYSWTHLQGENCLADGPVCGPDQTLVLIGGTENPWRPGDAYLRELRSCIRNAARVCVVGAAIFVPLAAGVLGAKQISVHPNFRPGVRECGRMLDIIERATCHHKALSSAISPTAAIRMMVELVGARDGEFTRSALSKYLGLIEPEEEGVAGEHWRYMRMAQGNMVISDALQIMLDHLEDTLSVGQIADILDVSPRKLERGFRDLLKQTPLKVYRDLRLDRARSLLAQTALPMNEISVACGFSNVTLMKKWFIEKYGELPGQVRQHAFGGAQAA
ncbi:HTH-type transcriptional regulator CdhR [Roseovarius litorisediminis]|uniref:HTH-type transcriptional regulator CdhR n=1 Tax=Roseovarius litorisediminis TaxID=1312363 RepID=A0A1Y5RJP8_9RHOB|nr:helix-turn-helix domain-containing protein [Roseovarius litorisediminis]SLN19202.1 HTH-type transcriptional regulator CdhR [Roseovarius litorisediminis]